MKPIEVKVTRAEKRGRKIVITIESDLYSDEVFAVNPFYCEGDAKNQLQATHFILDITEKGGDVKANVNFVNMLNHYTKGHSQMHQPIDSMFIDRKDCAKNWIISEKEEYFTEEKINKVLGQWENDPDFYKELNELVSKRKNNFYLEKLSKAKKNYHFALKELEKCLKIEINE